MQSRRHYRSRWAHANTPEALRRRRAAADASREAPRVLALAHEYRTLPLVNVSPCDAGNLPSPHAGDGCHGDRIGDDLTSRPQPSKKPGQFILCRPAGALRPRSSGEGRP